MSKNIGDTLDPLNLDPIHSTAENINALKTANEVGNFSNPTGSQESGFDVIGAAPLQIGGKQILDPTKPQDRAIGRAIGGAAAGYGAGAALGAGAGAGAGEGAAGGAAGGTGLTPGAAGITGITPGAGGASGLSVGAGEGAAGTALSPGFFASEGGGGAPTGAPASPIVEPRTGAVPGGGGQGLQATPSTSASPSAPLATPSSGSPAVSSLPVGGGGASDVVPPATTGAPPAPGTTETTHTPPAKTPLSTKVFNSIVNNPLQTAAIGTNLYGQVKANAASKAAEDRLKQASAGPLAASTQLLNEGLAGNVPPAIMQQFQTSHDQRVQEIKQRYANQGRDASTDSAAQQEIAKAQQDMDAQVANYANTLVTEGLSAAGVANTPTGQAAQLASNRDTALQQSMASVLQSMAQLQYLSQKQPGAVPAPTTPAPTTPAPIQ